MDGGGARPSERRSRELPVISTRRNRVDTLQITCWDGEGKDNCVVEW